MHRDEFFSNSGQNLNRVMLFRVSVKNKLLIKIENNVAKSCISISTEIEGFLISTILSISE